MSMIVVRNRHWKKPSKSGGDASDVTRAEEMKKA